MTRERVDYLAIGQYEMGMPDENQRSAMGDVLREVTNVAQRAVGPGGLPEELGTGATSRAVANAMGRIGSGIVGEIKDGEQLVLPESQARRLAEGTINVSGRVVKRAVGGGARVVRGVKGAIGKMVRFRTASLPNTSSTLGASSRGGWKVVRAFGSLLGRGRKEQAIGQLNEGNVASEDILLDDGNTIEGEFHIT
jgi:hypothetical protein